jgi:hypothetical protein
MDRESVAAWLRDIYARAGMLAGPLGNAARLEQADAIIALVREKVTEAAKETATDTELHLTDDGQPLAVFNVRAVVARVMGEEGK